MLLVLLLSSVESLVLHVKAGPDAVSIGDCPFAHALRIVLNTKGLPVDVQPHGPNNKPTWLVNDYGGKMPALEDNGMVFTESRLIADYLESTYPEPSMTNSPALEAAEEAAQPIFGCFARFAKCTSGEEEQTARKKALLLALCQLDAVLKEQARPFAAGTQISLADAFLLPALYHIKHAGEQLLDFEVPVAFESLCAYMDAGFACDVMRETAPDPAAVRWGWAQARGLGE